MNSTNSHSCDKPHLLATLQIGQHILSFQFHHLSTPYSVSQYSWSVNSSNMSERLIPAMCKTPRKTICSMFPFSLSVMLILNTWCVRVLNISVLYTFSHISYHSGTFFVNYTSNWQCIVRWFVVSDTLYTVQHRHNAIGLSNTSPVASDILQYQITRHSNHNVMPLGHNDTRL